MTPAQAKAVMDAAPMGWRTLILASDGLEGDRVQLMIGTLGGPVSVEVPIPAPLPLSPDELLAVAADAESRIRAVLAVNETDVGRGFNNDGRGALVTSSGYRAAEGWV